MPSFYTDAEVDVDVQEFLEACNDREITEIIEFLEENDYISSKQNSDGKYSVNELELHENLDAIYGKYGSLTKEEEQIIATIAKRFRYV
jgi:hypothetical protein